MLRNSPYTHDEHNVAAMGIVLLFIFIACFWFGIGVWYGSSLH